MSVCSNCRTENPTGARFCGECGSALAAAAAATAPASERRLVTVLVADLVGFTALSENRDAEEVR